MCDLIEEGWSVRIQPCASAKGGPKLRELPAGAVFSFPDGKSEARGGWWLRNRAHEEDGFVRATRLTDGESLTFSPNDSVVAHKGIFVEEP